MNNSVSYEYPWVIFTLKGSLMAISAENVQSMVSAPEAAAVPYTPPYVRGVINLRGVVVPLVDLRTRLGMPSFLTEIEDFCSLMDQREQDHRNWLKELEASVREKREFSLATDPHKCAFGKWYDNYKPESYTLSTILRQFDAPHRRIHGIAEKVLECERQGNTDAAMQIIDECRDNELAAMIKLFDRAKKVYRANSNEVSIVVEKGSSLVAMAVDTIESVEHFAEDSIEDAPETFGGDAETEFVLHTGRRKKDEAVVLVLDTEKVLTFQ